MLPKADSGGFVLLLCILTITDPPRTGKGVALLNAFAEMVFAAVWADKDLYSPVSRRPSGPLTNYYVIIYSYELYF